MPSRTHIRFLLIASLFVFLQPGVSKAQSTLDTVLQYTRQLKAAPDNYALKEKIILTSRRLKVPLPKPFEVDSYDTRGATAVNLNPTISGFKDALTEFQKANLAGPWCSEPYYNLAATQEATGDNKTAIENYRLYLLAAPDAKDALDVRKKIVELEYRA